MNAAIRLLDSHAHLDMEEFDPDRGEVLDRAFKAGIRTVLCPIDISSERSLAVTLNLPSGRPAILAAAGLHPHQAKLLSPAVLAAVERLAFEKKICAIGEIGLDFHYDHSTLGEQTRAFREQLALARAVNLPAIIHSREAGPDILRAVQAETFKNGGILHCFTEDWEFAAAMLDAGFFISFSGIITFPKSQALRDIAAKVPADRLLVETDAPYLAPVPNRGRRNEPAYVVETAACAARLKGMDLARFAETISRNFKVLFPKSN
jgi:TatD DNase family protein